MMKVHHMNDPAPSNAEVATLLGLPAETLQGHIIIGVHADTSEPPVLCVSTPDPMQVIAVLASCAAAIADQLQGHIWMGSEPPQ